jgi:hypothetical protein
MRFVGHHPFVDPDAAVRKIAEIANGVEAVQDDGFPSSASMNRFSRQAAAPTSSAPNARSRSAGYGGTRAAPM